MIDKWPEQKRQFNNSQVLFTGIIDEYSEISYFHFMGKIVSSCSPYPFRIDSVAQFPAARGRSEGMPGPGGNHATVWFRGS